MNRLKMIAIGQMVNPNGNNLLTFKWRQDCCKRTPIIVGRKKRLTVTVDSFCPISKRLHQFNFIIILFSMFQARLDIDCRSKLK